jgi:hypothetical protein
MTELKLKGANQGRWDRAELTKKKTVFTLELTELQLEGETRHGINKKKGKNIKIYQNHFTLELTELQLKGETRHGIIKTKKGKNIKIYHLWVMGPPRFRCAILIFVLVDYKL